MAGELNAAKNDKVFQSSSMIGCGEKIMGLAARPAESCPDIRR